MSVEFVFAVNDVVYRINRSYAKSARAGTRLELYQAADAERTRWDSLTGGTMRDTQAKITDDIVGMSYEVFSNSAYLRQGQADAFTRLAPTERRDLLAQMLEIDQYNIFRDRAKSKRDVLAREIANIQGQMAVDEANVTNIPGLSSQLQDADARVAQARSFVAYANAAVSRQTARQSLQQLDNQLALYTQRYADVTTEMAAAQAQLALRADIEARYAAYVAVEERYNTLNSMRKTPAWPWDFIVSGMNLGSARVVPRSIHVPNAEDAPLIRASNPYAAIGKTVSLSAVAAISASMRNGTNTVFHNTARET
jgi:exonuclease SbcC